MAERFGSGKVERGMRFWGDGMGKKKDVVLWIGYLVGVGVHRVNVEGKRFLFSLECVVVGGG